MWGWFHSVRLVKAHRLLCNMTYLGHTVTLTWRDLRSTFFKIHLSRITNIWIDPARRDEHDGVKIILLSLVREKLFMNKHFSKNVLFPFGDLSYLQY